MEKRVYNFSPGPAVLPMPVLEEAQKNLLCLPGAGSSILEISHRSKTCIALFESTQSNLKQLLNIPDNYKILFVQGGASMQFAMIPMNFLGKDQSADYILTGSWGDKAVKEVKKLGKSRLAWNGKDSNFTRVPKQDELDLDANAAYVHFTSNETIQGVEFQSDPETGNVPLICDMSSDFLSRPIDVSKYGMIYAGAQKNAGPSGICIVIVRDDLLERVPENLPMLLDYKGIAENESMLNTPPVFPVYIVNLVTKWLLEEIGGLEAMQKINQDKAALLYDAIDAGAGYYEGHAGKDSRSLMNVTWRMPNEDLDAKFVAEAKSKDLTEIKGHRSVGGMRASIYNAMPTEGVKKLADFMNEFRQNNPV
jgi:phosphoserine aminotransferase